MKALSRVRMGVLGLLGALAIAPLATFWAMNATPVHAAPVGYAAILTGPAESPPVASPGIGFAKVELDTVAHTLKVEVEFSGLLGATTVSHIHAPTAVAGAGTAGVATAVPTFPGFPAGVTSGTYAMAFDTSLAGAWNPAYIAANGGTPAGAEAAFATALADGKAYLNVHTAMFPGGEIRGFLTPPVVGGKDLKISTGSIDLSWKPGNVQHSYLLVKYDTSTASGSLITIAPDASSYSDPAVAPGVIYCYILAPIGGAGGPLGFSDLECAMSGVAGGPVEPLDFTLALNQSPTATLKWSPPAVGADTYLLAVIPLDGTPASYIPLPGAATGTTHLTVAAGTCFQLIGFKGPGMGRTNILCGIPGLSTLSSLGTGETGAQLMRAVEARMAGAILPSITE